MPASWRIAPGRKIRWRSSEMRPDQFVRQTGNGKVSYVYADLPGATAFTLGSQQAFQSVRGMQNVVDDMNRLEFGGGHLPTAAR